MLFRSFDWQPNGSLKVKVYLKSEIEHVKGPTAYGTFLRASSVARFQRIKQVANQVSNIATNKTWEELQKLENELNENYECEEIKINFVKENENVYIDIDDLYGARRVVVD